MKQYTIDELKKKNLITFEAIMGSHAYGTVLPTSDKDIRGAMNFRDMALGYFNRPSMLP